MENMVRNFLLHLLNFWLVNACSCYILVGLLKMCPGETRARPQRFLG